jgi:hypothetical protein
MALRRNVEAATFAILAVPEPQRRLANGAHLLRRMNSVPTTPAPFGGLHRAFKKIEIVVY